MEGQNERRTFLKRLLSLSAFSAASVLSFKRDMGAGIGKSRQIKMGPSEVRAKASGKRVKKIACEEHANTQDIANIDKRKGATPRNIVSMGTSFATPATVNILSPIGGVISPASIIRTAMTPNHMGLKPRAKITG